MPDLTPQQARKMLEAAKKEAREVILVLTVEQALLAAKVVREAGREAK